ncbi:hypothetical protein BH23ACT9_BH23ACT9_38460 [soil metagenome]
MPSAKTDDPIDVWVADGTMGPVKPDLPVMPELVSGSTRVRPWRLDDLTCVEQASADDRIPRGTTVPSQFTADAGRQWIHRQWGRYVAGEGWSSAIADATTDEAVGFVALLLRPLPGVAGVGYWVVPQARRLGHASHAVRVVRDWALAGGGCSRVEAWVEPGNAGSISVMDVCGFHFEDRLRSFLALDSGRSDALVFSSIAEDR